MSNSSHDINIQRRSLGRTGIAVPPVVFGATSLGNLFRAISDSEKHEIVCQWFKQIHPPVMIDTAGKYGAGLSLEVIGRELELLRIPPSDVILSNKLGWRREPLRTLEPTFEPGVWMDIRNDAIQEISYDGIVRCWEEGNSLLGGFRAKLISVHDPDEYLAAAVDQDDANVRLNNIVEAYRALTELRDAGQASAVGVGAKNWKTIQLLSQHCDFDWVMFANSFTIMHHPAELSTFMEGLSERGVGIINSALFHGGFLVGGEYFDYRKLDPSSALDRKRLQWRDRFWKICEQFEQTPFDVACAFGRSHPAITTIALSSGRAGRIAEHVQSIHHVVPSEVWETLKTAGLIE